MRDETLERIHYVRQILQRSYPVGVTYQQLAREIEDITRDRRPAIRTLIRDIERLQRQGLEIHMSFRDRCRVLSLSPDEKEQSLPISDVQLLALSLAQEMLEPLRGTIFWNGIRSFWHETMSKAPEQTQRYYEKKRQQVVVRGKTAKSYSDKGGILSTLFEAQLSHREVEIDYQKPGEQPTPRCVRPYSIAFHEGSIYIVADDAGRGGYRTFKLDRITRADRTDTFFQPDPEFDPQHYFAGSLSVFGSSGKSRPRRVRAKLLTQNAVNLVRERPMSPDQEITVDGHGQYMLTIPSVYEGEFIRQVLAFEEDIEIISPASCRAKMIRTLDKMRARYGA